jgi:hypothetical protein
MTAWFLFGILAFLVFGMPLIDDLYKINKRRKASTSGSISHESPSFVPNVNRQDLPESPAEVIRVLEDA